MGKRLLIGLVGLLASGMVACLVPTFEGMSGEEATSGGPTGRPDSGPTTDSAGPVDDPTSDGGGGGSTAPKKDASPEASTVSKQFSCGSSGTRCALGPETCCGIFASTEPVCRPIATPGDCEGTLPCGDATDCSAGNVCCYDANTGTGSCQASCNGTQKMTICDPQKPTCPGTAKCNGRFWGLPYCI